MIAIPEELPLRFERGNVLLSIGERIVRTVEGRALLSIPSREAGSPSRLRPPRSTRNHRPYRRDP